MVIENIIKHLEILNFSRIEAQVYVTLVKHSKLNGSQIAKILNLSRSSVYSALNSLYNKGIVFLLPGESNVYKAQDPDILLETLSDHVLERPVYLQPGLYIAEISESGYLGQVLFRFAQSN